MSGTVPGLPLPGGLAALPVNWDIFSDLVMALLNSPVFSNFMGTLDADGRSTAQLNIPAFPVSAGIIMHYAFCCNNPFDFVSNPVAIEMVPRKSFHDVDKTESCICAFNCRAAMARPPSR